MNETRLIIDYSIDSEIDRVKYTLSKLDWYKEKGYKIKIPDIDTNTTTKDIEIAVTKDFTEYENEYRFYKDRLQQLWREFFPNFIKIKEDSKLNFLDSYTVLLTRYGTGGSYNSDLGTIDLRFTERNIDSIFGTILHEIIHIAVEPFIKKYNIDHWKKERLVDLVGLKYFPNFRKAQDIKEDVSKVDKAFTEFFPDIEKVLKNINN